MKKRIRKCSQHTGSCKVRRIAPEPKSASYRIELGRLGRHFRFLIRSGDVNKPSNPIVTSSLFSTAKESQQALIDLLMAIQRDDFETFDLT